MLARYIYGINWKIGPFYVSEELKFLTSFRFTFAIFYAATNSNSITCERKHKKSYV